MSNTIDGNKLVDLAGIAVVRDWANNHFLRKSDAGKMMGTKIRLTFGPDFVGQTYTVTGGADESYTGTVPDVRIVEVVVRELDDVYTVSCTSEEGTSYEREIMIGNYYGKYPLDFFTFLAYLHVKADPGVTITATTGDKTYTGITDNAGHRTLYVGAAGTYAVTATLNGKTTKAVTVEVTDSGEIYECLCPPMNVKIVSWADGTDEEIAAMLDAARAGEIDLQEHGGWAVGDTRTIRISAFTGGFGTNGNRVNHSGQDMDIAISSFEDYNGCGCKMQFDFKNCLAENSALNNAKSNNTGGYRSTQMYEMVLPALADALPAWLRERLITFTVRASAGSKSTAIDEIPGNRLALRAEIEVQGSRTYSTAGEGTQIEYYKTAKNRGKCKGNYSNEVATWWLRSPNVKDTNGFCIVSKSSASNYYPNQSSPANLYWISPFGCL